MGEKFKEIFEIKDIVWFVIGLALPYLWNLVKGKIQSFQMKRKIKKGDMEFADSSIISLAHGDPFFATTAGEQALRLDVPREMFYISMPVNIKKEIIEAKPDFFNTKWKEEQVFFDNQIEDDMLKEVSGILGLSFEDTKKIYLEEKENVAKIFLGKAMTGAPYFNGKMYGIKK